MKLTLSGRPIGMKIDKDDKTFVALEIPCDNINLQEVLPFVKLECALHIQSSKRDLNTKGYIEELALKTKLKLKIRCTEDVDLNIVNQLIADPEVTSIVFNDEQSSLTDFETAVKAEYHGKNKVLKTAVAMINEFGLEGAKNVCEAAVEAKTTR